MQPHSARSAPLFITSGMCVYAYYAKTTQCHRHYLTPILSEFSSASNEYSAKLASGKATDKMLKTLAWNVDNLSRLSSDGWKMRTEALADS